MDNVSGDLKRSAFDLTTQYSICVVKHYFSLPQSLLAEKMYRTKNGIVC